MKRHLYILGLIDSPLCRRCGAEEKTSDYVCVSVQPCLHLDVITWAPSSWKQRMLGVKDWRQSGASVRENGCHVLASVYWAQRDCQTGLCASEPKGLKSSLFSILFYSILFYSILFYSILYYSVLFYSILFYSILLYSILFYSVLFCSILFYSILFYSILFYSILFCSILFYSILFYSVLFCSILFCSILFCSILF